MPLYCNENCNVVAVTLEKNVEIVVMLTYCVVAFPSSSATNVGSAGHSKCQYVERQVEKNVHFSLNVWSSALTERIAISRVTKRSSNTYCSELMGRLNAHR